MPHTLTLNLYGGPFDGQTREVPDAVLGRRRVLRVEGEGYQIERYVGWGVAADGVRTRRTVTVLTHGEPGPYEDRIKADHFADLAHA